MDRTSQVLLIVFITTFSHLTKADDNLSQHLISVCRAMSAFYMISLSDGDDTHRVAFSQHIKDADNTLKKMQKTAPDLAARYQPRWNTLRPLLKYKYVEGAGYIIPISTRQLFREYLHSVYHASTTHENYQSASLTEQLLYIAIDIEILTARYFDLSSALYGVLSIVNAKSDINITKISHKIKTRLTTLQTIDLNKTLLKKLRSAETKWAFIKPGVLDSEKQSTVFLVFYNKNKISKLLLSHKNLVTLD